jgi:hypothetical protein
VAWSSETGGRPYPGQSTLNPSLPATIRCLQILTKGLKPRANPGESAHESAQNLSQTRGEFSRKAPILRGGGASKRLLSARVWVDGRMNSGQSTLCVDHSVIITLDHFCGLLELLISDSYGVWIGSADVLRRDERDGQLQRAKSPVREESVLLACEKDLKV